MSWISLFTLVWPLLAPPTVLPCDDAPCACAPCCCEDTGKCANGTCESCPAPQAAACPCPISVPCTGPCTVPPPPCVSGGCSPVPPPPPAHSQGKKLYEVQVNLSGKEHGCVSPKVVVVEGGHALVSMNDRDGSGKPDCRMLHVHLGKARGDCVPLELTVTPAGRAAEKLTGVETIHLSTVTALLLMGRHPEPCCAQVTVSPLSACSPCTPVQMQQACVAPPAPCAPPPPMVCPAGPHPRPAPMQMTFVRTPMPAPPMPTLPPAPRLVVEYVPTPVPVPYGPALPCPMAVPMPHPPMPSLPPMTVAAVPTPPCPTVLGYVGLPPFPTAAPGSHVRVVHEAGKARLKMQTVDGTVSTAAHLKVQTNEVGCLHLAAGKQHVHVSGKLWKASADHVEMYPDGRVVLTGHVKVVSAQVGVCSSLKGDRVCLGVKHGKVETVMGGMVRKK